MTVLLLTLMCVCMEARAALCAHRAMDAAATRTALASYWVMKDFKEGKEVRWSTWMGIYLAVGLAFWHTWASSCFPLV